MVLGEVVDSGEGEGMRGNVVLFQTGPRVRVECDIVIWGQLGRGGGVVVWVRLARDKVL